MSIRVGMLLVSVMIFITGAALAQSEADLQISQDPTASEQNAPSVAAGLGGNFAAVWTDRRNGNSDIFAQTFDSGHLPVGNNRLLNDDANGAWQTAPDLSADWYGRFYAAWQDYRQEGYPFGPDIYLQIFTDEANVGENRNLTIEIPDSSHTSPSLSAFGWGGAVAAWTDLRANNWDVFAQQLDEDGNLSGPNFKVNDDLVLARQHAPAVGQSPFGWFAITWYDSRGGDDDIYLQLFDASGAPVGVNIQANDDSGSKQQKFPQIAVGGNGNIYVVWSDWRNGTYPQDPDIYLQIFDSSLNRIDSNQLVNIDFSATAQRDPAVAADRAGNACVVWSDSSKGEWNVTGQMIEYTGRLRGPNFPVNLEADGKQLDPDIAMDGFDLYAVWTDNRNGNWDIYGRIITYNEPALIPLPRTIVDSIDRSDPNPVEVPFVITNAGYGELSYRLSTATPWISISTDSGQTPDTVVVTLTGADLDFGPNNGLIRLIESESGDSTGLLPVILHVTGPEFTFLPDSLQFKALLEVGPPPAQKLIIQNSGTGSLHWSVGSAPSWMTLTQTSGSENDTLDVNCTIGGLSSGVYDGFIVFEDPAAAETSDSVYVNFTIDANQPYLRPVPDSLHFDLFGEETRSQFIQITNVGAGELNWTSSSSTPWLTAIPAAGTTDDSLEVIVDRAMLETGSYLDSIIVRDDAAFNDQIAIPVTVICFPADTVEISPQVTTPGLSFQTPVVLNLHNDFQEGIFSFTFDSEVLQIDSIIPDEQIISSVSVSADSSFFSISIDASVELAPGQHRLAELYFTSSSMALDSTIIRPDAAAGFRLTINQDFEYFPAFAGGLVEFSEGTAVDDPSDPGPSNAFALDQNRPNPFNSATEIAFALPRAATVKISVYNVLGQHIVTLVDRAFPSGRHRVLWNGDDSYGHELGSGIYFYRLESGNLRAVRKLVILK